jgi:hypothetical protein
VSPISNNQGYEGPGGIISLAEESALKQPCTQRLKVTHTNKLLVRCFQARRPEVEIAAAGDVGIADKSFRIATTSD